MDEIIFYSIGCPNCKTLKYMLDKKGIQYNEINDVDYMMNEGIKSSPSLKVNGKILNFNEALKWLKDF